VETACPLSAHRKNPYQYRREKAFMGFSVFGKAHTHTGLLYRFFPSADIEQVVY
jgi:hypothetical protein